MKQQTKLAFVPDNTAALVERRAQQQLDLHPQRLTRVIIVGSFDYICAELARLEALQSAI